MTDGRDALSGEQLAFFGKVSAGISHELKNIMATISETASLLSDLVAYGEQGGKLEQQELRTCSEGIIEEIQRGFATIKHMNRFAHSVDQPLKEIDIKEVLELTVSLWTYMGPSRKVNIDSQGETGPRVITNPFLLQDLLYHALVFAFESVEPDGEIRISLGSKDQEARIDFPGTDAGGADSFQSEKVKAIAGAIRAKVLPSSSGGGFCVVLPSEIEVV